MLSVNSYAQEYIDECRARVAAQLTAYQTLVAAARDQVVDEEAPLEAAVASFEPEFFNNMVLVLDTYFCHRSRGLEGKDGNPLNEVRVLCTSMMQHGSRLCADKTIKLRPDTSILGHEVGDEIRLTEPDFVLLSEAFFSEIEDRYR